MRADDVTLGERALSLCEQLGISVNDAKNARSSANSTYPAPEFLMVIGTLPDGRSIRMWCRHDRPAHIVSFRPLPRS
jgi:hypothetical protein